MLEYEMVAVVVEERMGERVKHAWGHSIPIVAREVLDQRLPVSER